MTPCESCGKPARPGDTHYCGNEPLDPGCSSSLPPPVVDCKLCGAVYPSAGWFHGCTQNEEVE